MARFIKLTNRYGDRTTIFVNVDNIDYMKEIVDDEEHDGNPFAPGTEIAMKDCVIYADEELADIMGMIVGYKG